MRSLLLGIVILVWILLGFKTCTDYNVCCADPGTSQQTIGQESMAASSTAAAETDSKEKSETIPKSKTGPILFNYENQDAVLGENWTKYKSDLLNGLKDGQLLQITGYYSNDEKAPSGYDNMGLARADETRKALGLSEDQVQLRSEVSDRRISKDGLSEAVSFRNITVNKSIDESIENKTIIRFPYNSTNKLDDNTVETYLDKVAARVKKSGERVRLTGHTDSDGSDESNIRLGQRRADVIKNYLISKGVSASKIISDSKGESQPVASNGNSSGKAQNRRTELEIIK